MPPSYPHENLNRVPISIRSFNRRAEELNAPPTADTPPSRANLDLARFVLAGRLTYDDDSQDLIDIKKPGGVAARDGDNVTERSFGSMTGITHSTPLNVDLVVYPLHVHGPRMDNRMEIKVNEMHAGPGERTYRNIPIHTIPHFELAHSVDKQITIWVCLPDVYFRGCSPIPWESDVGRFYQECMRPEMEANWPTFQPSIWPPTYAAIYVKDADTWASTVRKSELLPAHLVSNFGSNIIERARNNVHFEHMFFVIQYTPPPTPHTDFTAAALEHAYSSLTEIFTDRTADFLSAWTIDVKLTFSRSPDVVIWTKRGMQAFLEHVLDVEAQEASVLLEDREVIQSGATEWAADEVVVKALDPGSHHGISFLKFTHMVGGRITKIPQWRSFKGHDVFPRNIHRFVEHVKALQSAFQTAAADPRDAETPYATSKAQVLARMTMSSAKRGLSTSPPLNGLTMIIRSEYWWRMKFWRATGILHAARILRTTPPHARFEWKSSLALGLVLVHILNTMVVPQPISPLLQDLLHTAAYHHIEDADDAEAEELGWAEDSAVPALESRGFYFVADIEANPIPNSRDSWRLAGVEEFGREEISEETWALLYSKKTYSDILQAFGMGAARSRRHREAEREDRIHKNNPSTSNARALWKRPNPTPHPFLGLAQAHITILPRYALVGRDIRAFDADPERDEDALISSEDIYEVLNNIFLQLCHDIIAKSPNRRAGSVYTTLTPAERNVVPPEMFQQTTLPFECAHVVAVTESTFTLIINHLLPSQGHITKPNARGFPSCLYYKSWIDLLNRLDADDAYLVVHHARRVLKGWSWLPFSEAGAMWVSKSMGIGRNITTLPRGWAEPAPIIAVNPWCLGEGGLRRFALRK